MRIKGGQRQADKGLGEIRHYGEVTESKFPLLTALWQRPVVLFATAALISLAAYVATLAPDLTWANAATDGGDLITASVTLGVPHPPGYPTYVLAGKLFSLIPIGTIAFRFNLFSAVCMAAATGLLALTARQGPANSFTESITYCPEDSKPAANQLARRHGAALGSALLFAFLPLVWRQAIVSEVYALNLLVVAALVWSLLSRAKQTAPWLPGLLLGLALTTHLTSLLLAPAVLGLTPVRRWPKVALGFAIGLLPFLAIPALAQGASPVIWGQPTNLDGWWWLVSAQIYRPNLFSLAPGHWLERLAAWLQEPSVLIAIAMSLVVMVRRRSRHDLPRRAPVLLASVAGLYALYAFFYDTPDSLVFLLPAFLLLSVLFATIHAGTGRLLLVLPLLLLVLNFQRIDLSDVNGQRPLVESLLEEAPDRAILFTDGEEETFALWYFLYAERRRSDLIVVDENLFAFNWYRQALQRRYPDLVHTERDDLAGFRRHNAGRRPQCKVILQRQATSASITCGNDAS